MKKAIGCRFNKLAMMMLVMQESGECSRLLRNRFHWANINQDMEQHIKRCESCLKFKTKQEVAPMETIHVTHLMELVYMGYLTIESNKQDKDVNILVVYRPLH